MCMAEVAVGLSGSHPVLSVTLPVLLLSLMRIPTDVLELGTRKQPACGGKEEYSDKILITGENSFSRWKHHQVTRGPSYNHHKALECSWELCLELKDKSLGLAP